MEIAELRKPHQRESQLLMLRRRPKLLKLLQIAIGVSLELLQNALRGLEAQTRASITAIKLRGVLQALTQP